MDEYVTTRDRTDQSVTAPGGTDEAPVPPFTVASDAPGRMVRVRDVVLAVLGLVALLPLLLLLALLVRLDSPGPALFTHRRLGRFGRHFDCYKFRTMVTDADDMLDDLVADDPDLARQYAELHKLDPDPRVTRLGGVLRRLSLDELPQLLNVLRGEMSLVGPRPIVDAERARYGARLPEVHTARPGMTGLWQVSGRSGTSYARRVELDVEYVRTRTFSMDLRIIARTIVQAFRRENGAA